MLGAADEVVYFFEVVELIGIPYPVVENVLVAIDVQNTFLFDKVLITNLPLFWGGNQKKTHRAASPNFLLTFQSCAVIFRQKL